jgi:hypothetical protein
MSMDGMSLPSPPRKSANRSSPRNRTQSPPLSPTGTATVSSILDPIPVPNTVPPAQRMDDSDTNDSDNESDNAEMKRKSHLSRMRAGRCRPARSESARMHQVTPSSPPNPSAISCTPTSHNYTRVVFSARSGGKTFGHRRMASIDSVLQAKDANQRMDSERTASIDGVLQVKGPNQSMGHTESASTTGVLQAKDPNQKMSSKIGSSRGEKKGKKVHRQG